ncbi:MAG: hypothetical protein HOH58_08875 [Opitutaceae bacterium]|jgi:hypothetical protein|nr:hypothetical protein [Opitutaceae bacterium]
MFPLRRSSRGGSATLVCAALLLSIGTVHAKSLDLASSAGLTLHHCEGESVTFEGESALRLTYSPPPATEQQRLDHLAIVDGLDFTNGTIEVELAGQPNPNASGGARGFVGVAFRVQEDRETYDCFYLRPTNGRAEDQERRNHTVQYMSHPDYPWFKLRKENPSRYESYVDITPATWIHLRIEVDGDKAKLFIDGRDQPSLIVNDVKSGAEAMGSVAIWFEGSTIAHARNLKITPR